MPIKPRETIARARGIKNILEQIAGHNEIGIAPEQNGAELAPLDHQCVRTHLQNLGSGLAQIVFSRQHAGFVIVDEQEVPVLNGFEQFLAKVADPEVHGVAARQAHVLHLGANAALQAGYCRAACSGHSDNFPEAWVESRRTR